MKIYKAAMQHIFTCQYFLDLMQISHGRKLFHKTFKL